MARCGIGRSGGANRIPALRATRAKTSRNVFAPAGKRHQEPLAPLPHPIMILTRSKFQAITSGLIACVMGVIAIMAGDHHVELPFKLLVALGVTLVLGGLFLLRYSWAIRERR